MSSFVASTRGGYRQYKRSVRTKLREALKSNLHNTAYAMPPVFNHRVRGRRPTRETSARHGDVGRIPDHAGAVPADKAGRTQLNSHVSAVVMEMLINQQYSLRKFVKEDAHALYTALKDPRVVRHMVSDGLTQHDCEAIIQEALDQWATYGIGSYAVVNTQTHVIVGWAGYKRWKDEGYELLCVLQPSSWGIGYDIAKTLITYAFRDLRLPRLFALLPETRRSFRFIRKMGFEFSGIERFAGERFQKFVMPSSVKDEN